VLERRGPVVWLVDARQMKYVPGRKSDVQDFQWLQKLMSLGLLRAAWRPGDEVCVVRAVVRQREVLLTEQADWVQRMQKALVQMNLQLTEVLTDVMGMTGQAIVRAIVAGERDPKVLARHPMQNLLSHPFSVSRSPCPYLPSLLVAVKPRPRPAIRRKCSLQVPVRSHTTTTPRARKPAKPRAARC
jgi:hypothetical protein